MVLKLLELSVSSSSSVLKEDLVLFDDIDLLKFKHPFSCSHQNYYSNMIHLANYQGLRAHYYAMRHLQAIPQNIK